MTWCWTGKYSCKKWEMSMIRLAVLSETLAWNNLHYVSGKKELYILKKQIHWFQMFNQLAIFFFISFEEANLSLICNNDNEGFRMIKKLIVYKHIYSLLHNNRYSAPDHKFQIENATDQLLVEMINARIFGHNVYMSRDNLLPSVKIYLEYDLSDS